MREGKVKPGFKYIRTHMIIDIKTEVRFTCKSRLVASGNKTANPSFITYSSVATRENVRLAFLISGLSNLEICACNIGNAYLNDPCW